MQKIARRTLSLCFFVVIATALRAQTPMGQEFQANQHTADLQESPVVAVSAAGDFALAWADLRDALFGGVPGKVHFTVLRFFDAQGRPQTGELYPLGREGNDHGDSPVALLTAPGSGYELVMQKNTFSRPSGILQYGLQKYSGIGMPQGEPVLRPQLEGQGGNAAEAVYQISPLPSGDMWFLWGARRGDIEIGEVLACQMTPQGMLIGEPTSLALDLQHLAFPGGMGLDGQTRPVVIWHADCGDDPSTCDVFGQRLSPQGDKLGEPVRLNAATEGFQFEGHVGVAPDGSFLAVWQSDHPYPYAIIGRHFSSDFKPTGAEFLISPADPHTFALMPRVSTDAAGRSVVVWANFRRENDAYGWDVLARSYRPDGTEITRRPLRLNQFQAPVEFANPAVSFGGNGTFVVAWEGYDADANGIFAQRFALWPGDEACVQRGTQVLCDAGRRGGDAEWELTGLGLEQGGTLVFGDVDGDGRADPCVRRGKSLRCDTDHFGAPFEQSITFGSGRRGEELFLADVDGDGRVEPCVHEGRTWKCDTGHDGGRTGLVFTYGKPGERGLMGDVDGDGRADACVVRSGRLHCDTGHGRPGKETVLDFPAGGGELFLGDFDGDRRADTCTFSDGTFRCDIAHDASKAPATLKFGKAGDRPLLGNLDGF